MQNEQVQQADRVVAEFGELTEDQVGNQMASPRILWQHEFSLNPAGHGRGSQLLSRTAGTGFTTDPGTRVSAGDSMAGYDFVGGRYEVRVRFQDLRGLRGPETGVHRESSRLVLVRGPQTPAGH